MATAWQIARRVPRLKKLFGSRVVAPDFFFLEIQMSKGVRYFKIDAVHNGKEVKKHFVSLAGLTDVEMDEAVGALIDLVLHDADDSHAQTEHE
jgi:hypothetical protein